MARPFCLKIEVFCSFMQAAQKLQMNFVQKIWKIKGNISAELCNNLCVAEITCCADEPIRFHVPGTTGSFSLDNLICASCAKGVSVQKKAQPVKAGVAKPWVYPE